MISISFNAKRLIQSKECLFRNRGRALKSEVELMESRPGGLRDFFCMTNRYHILKGKYETWNNRSYRHGQPITDSHSSMKSGLGCPCLYTNKITFYPIDLSTHVSSCIEKLLVSKYFFLYCRPAFIYT